MSRKFAQVHKVICRTGDTPAKSGAPKHCHYTDLFSSIMATRNNILADNNLITYLQYM